MSSMDLLLVVAAIILLVGFFLIFLLLGRSSPQRALLAEVANQWDPAGAAGLGGRGFSAERFARPLGKLRGMFGGAPNPEIVRRLMLAGYRKPYHADVFIGIRLLLPAIAGFAVAFCFRDNVIFIFILTVVLTFFLPDFWLGRAVNKRRDRIKRSLPDALDLLAICMEAGLGVDQALMRVGQELKISHRDLSDEFVQINLEQRAGNPRIGAWRNMADRVDVESVRSFVNMLAQTERFGTPISKSLATFSEALRVQRRQRAEEMAAKTTIKLVLPLVLFIFPSIFIVTAAPAVITIIKSFKTVI